MQNQWKFSPCQIRRGKSDKPYLQRRLWRNQTDLTTDSKQNVSLNQSLWTSLTQFQAKTLTGLSWNTESHHLWIIYNEFSSLRRSECSACCPEISGSSSYFPPASAASSHARCSRDIPHRNAEAKSWRDGLNDAVTGCSVRVRVRPCQQRRAATSTCGYTPVITWCPLFIHTAEHLGVSIYLLAQPYLAVCVSFSG